MFAFVWRKLSATYFRACNNLGKNLMFAQTSLQSSAHRLFAEGRILAGFLTDDQAAAISQFMRAPASEQALVRQKFGAAEKISREPMPHPSFRHVDESEII